MNKTRTLDLLLYYQVCGQTQVEVPAELNLEQAVQYAKEHIDKIALPKRTAYVPDSDEIDEESVKFI